MGEENNDINRIHRHKQQLRRKNLTALMKRRPSTPNKNPPKAPYYGRNWGNPPKSPNWWRRGAAERITCIYALLLYAATSKKFG